MTKVLQGIVHGKTIELDSDTGLEDGRRVEITLTARALPAPPPNWSPENTKTAAGMMADSWTDEDDLAFEEIYQQRKKESSTFVT